MIGFPVMCEPDEWGFAPAVTNRRAPDGRMIVGWQRNAEGTFDRVFSDGSGLTPVTSPRLKTVLANLAAEPNITGEK